MLSKNISDLRLKFNYTLETIAEFLDVTVNEVSQYESGGCDIPIDKISKLALLYDVEELDLYEKSFEDLQSVSDYAFRAPKISAKDLKVITNFRKIVNNHYFLKTRLSNEH